MGIGDSFRNMLRGSAKAQEPENVHLNDSDEDLCKYLSQLNLKKDVDNDMLMAILVRMGMSQEEAKQYFSYDIIRDQMNSMTFSFTCSPGDQVTYKDGRFMHISGKDGSIMAVMGICEDGGIAKRGYPQGDTKLNEGAYDKVVMDRASGWIVSEAHSGVPAWEDGHDIGNVSRYDLAGILQEVDDYSSMRTIHTKRTLEDPTVFKSEENHRFGGLETYWNGVDSPLTGGDWYNRMLPESARESALGKVKSHLSDLTPKVLQGIKDPRASRGMSVLVRRAKELIKPK